MLTRPVRSTQRAFTLVLVLLFVVLLTALAIGLLVIVLGEKKAAHINALALSVHDLSDSTLNLVVSQIKDATSGTTPTGNQPVAWASQPGLIRTFQGSLVSSTNPTGQYQAFKLYSSPTMTVTGGAPFDPQTDSPSPTWYAAPALYTDLNAPVNRPDSSAANGSFTIYPVADPTASGIVNGFQINNAPVNPSPNNGATPNPLPMPVQWLYQLKDGSLIAADKTSTSVATFTGAPTQPSAGNPIVGRVAFWTDDDTCKVNINTAAGDEWSAGSVSVPNQGGNGNVSMDVPGAYSDAPRFYSGFDQVGLQMFFPSNGEYQRYPGHPATTFLSTVFPALTRSQIAQLAPRVEDGGSEGGTQPATPLLTKNPPNPRLYASVDELAFAQPSTGGPRPAQTILTPQQIEQARFFLTAHSRAPELNLFGGPRVSVWPVMSTSSYLTSFDQLIAFCTTVGSGASAKGYYFQRTDPSSATADWSTIPRNQQIYSYLQQETSSDIPGFGGNFLTKLGGLAGDRDQVLTEIFDYIRTVNILDPTTGSHPYADGTNGSAPNVGSGAVVPIEINIDGNKTRGLGRFPIVSQVALCFWANKFYTVPVGQANGTKVATQLMTPYLLIDKFCPMQGFPQLITTFDETVSGLGSLQISWDNGVTWSPMGFQNSVNYTSPADFWLNFYCPVPRFFGGCLGVGADFYNPADTLKIRTPGVDAPFSAPPLTVQPVQTPTTANQIPQSPFLIKSGPITIIISAPGNGGNNPIQTYTFSFPQTTMQVPNQIPIYSGTYETFTNRVYGNYNIESSDATVNSTIYGGGDSVKSVELAGPNMQGDLRFAAIRKSVTTGDFAPHQLYFDTHTWDALSIRNSQGQYGGCNADVPRGAQMFGALDPSIPYQAYNLQRNGSNPEPSGSPFPYFPSSLSQTAGSGALLTRNNGLFLPGDWDTGIGDAVEASYSSMADEGANAVLTGNNYPYYGGTVNPSTPTTFSPNRQISSAVAFGSLPSGYARNRPWQTLLFCPNPQSGTVIDPTTNTYIANHPGRDTPPDYLLLDLFTMPVVEPYAISEPFSTAGKINLNYQIAPFTYLKRDTAMRAVLRSTRVTAVDSADAGLYHSQNYGSGQNYRYPVQLDQTLADFDQRFSQNRPFRSAAEICDMYLVPDVSEFPGEGQPTCNNGVGNSSPVAKWWYSGGKQGLGLKLTGDNAREKPYGDLYPRLTTQSNTYTVYVRVQKLKNPTALDQTTWNENQGVIEGEYRGSYTIERYIDPNDPHFVTGGTYSNPNYYVDPDQSNPAQDNLNQLAKFRVLETKRFSP